MNENDSQRHFQESLAAYYLLNEARRAASKEFWKGLAWLIGGLTVTALTGFHLIFWGAVVYGIYRFVRGLYYRAKPEALIKKVLQKKQKQH